MRWFDAHNHLQNSRLGNDPLGWVSAAAAAGIAGMVVNGTCEGDWPEVRRLAELCPSVIPAFGLHPPMARCTDRVSGPDAPRRIG
jgi:TatD DNase family protein